MSKKYKYTAVSLFCGAGGLDMGFDRAGFETIWANDFNKDACDTYKLWNKNAYVYCGDITKYDLNDIPHSDIILGGFPCQGFSFAGPRKLDDSRNALYKYYVETVKRNKPLAFIGENVKGLLTMGKGQVIDAIVESFAECGYDVYYKLLNAKDFGVAQDRKRVIICGFQKKLHIKDFELPDGIGKPSTLSDALAGMPECKPEDVCDAPFSSRYMSRNRKRGWDEVSFTIPAMAKQVTLYPGSPDMVHVGTDEWQFGDGGETRRLSYKECAAIQTFPPDMTFCGDLTSKYKQIGNAVPVLLAQRVAEYVRGFLQ